MSESQVRPRTSLLAAILLALVLGQCRGVTSPTAPGDPDEPGVAGSGGPGRPGGTGVPGSGGGAAGAGGAGTGGSAGGRGGVGSADGGAGVSGSDGPGERGGSGGASGADGAAGAGGTGAPAPDSGTDAIAPAPDSGADAVSRDGRDAGDPLTAGWTVYDPQKTIQLVTRGENTSYPYPTTTSVAGAGSSYERSNGIETFKLFNNNASNRVEIRAHDDYAMGLRQFAGDVRIIPPLDDESLMQVFGLAGGSSLLMIKGYAASGGTLMKQGGNVVVATGVYGKWVRVNVIHDATNRKMSVYIDGQLKVSESVGTVGPDRPFHYHKWGCYGTLRTESAQVEWRNVTLYMK